MPRPDWCNAAGRLIDTIDATEFPDALSTVLREIVTFDYTVIFGYVGHARPLDLYDDFPKQKRRIFVEDYQEGPYLLDPFFLASINDLSPGLWRLREIAPDRFYQGEYFRNYYVRTGLAEEIGYLVRIEADTTVVVSLMRAGKRFGSAEVRALREAWPVVDAACRRHWRDLCERAGVTQDRGEAVAVQQSIEQAFRTIGQGVLTPRERQVVELTLRGHSADATGRILGISSGTVRIHRRNIYSKLRINSQGELFSEFIAAMLKEPGANSAPGASVRVGPAPGGQFTTAEG